MTESAASAVLESALATQYIVLSGYETTADVPRILGRLVLPAHVVISYRHAAISNRQFLHLLLSEIGSHGVRDVATIFASADESERVKAIVEREGMTFTAR